MIATRVAAGLFAAVIALAACSQRGGNSADVDVGNAASSAQNDIDAYAAGSPAPTRAPISGSGKVTASAVPISEPVAPTPTPSPDEPPSPNSLSEATPAPESAQAAADVVQTYYALLEAGRYREAWRLWADDGRASGMRADAFAASFAKYRDYHAIVGSSGRVDAGAGQRYVEVPVRVHGRLKAGDAPFVMAGPVTLHRVSDIDGATQAQRSWRISASGVRPRPDQDASNPE